MESVTEEWRAVPGHEGEYEVSNLGNVRSLDRTEVNSRGRIRRLKGRILKVILGTDGYGRVALGKRCRKISVHQIVARTFLGDQPNGIQVNHIDGKKINNAASNLEYVTPKQNMQHAIATGLRDDRGEKSSNAKFTNKQMQESYDLVRSGVTVREAAERTGVSACSVRDAVHGKRRGFARIV